MRAPAQGKPREMRLVLIVAASLLVLIVLVSVFAPATEDDDTAPVTTNTGSAGVKAAFLLLQNLGYSASQWNQPVEDLASVDAQSTTLILASPYVNPEEQQVTKGAIADFLNRGGRVLVTGQSGAYVVPEGHTAPSTRIYTALCFTTPDGLGPLARAGQVSMGEGPNWGENGDPGVRVEQRCGRDAVVARYNVGPGEVVWWSAPTPMSNRGLKEDASLRLLLASVGAPGRQVLFDESFHAAAGSIWDAAKGLPIASLFWQTTFVALLLVLSFGRRSGPTRLPLRTIRSSPLEFAESMGHLYNKAVATHVATESARRRLLRFLHERCGLPKTVVDGAPSAIAEAVQHRFGGDWSALGIHLDQAHGGEYKELSRATALALVKALDGDIARLKQQISMTSANPQIPVA